MTVIGLAPSPDLLLALKDQLSLRIPSRSVAPKISTALFRRGQELYLYAVNHGDEGNTADIVLGEDFLKEPCWRARNLVSGQEWTVDLRASGRLTFPLPRKDGVIIQLRGA